MAAIRVLPLRASVGHLAEELARLDRAKAQLEQEIEQMSAAQVPSGDDLVRALAQEVAVEEARVAAKREALARAEAALRTQAKDAEAASEAQRAAELQRRRQALLDAEDMRLAAVGRAEQLLRKWVEAANTMVRAHEDVVTAVAALSGGARVLGGNTLSSLDFSERTVGRLVSLLKTLKVQGAPHRLGRSLDLPNSSLHPVGESWVERERAIVEPVVRELVQD